MIRRLISGWSRRRGLMVGAAGSALIGLILGLVVSLGDGNPRAAVVPELLPGPPTTTVPSSAPSTTTVGNSVALPTTAVTSIHHIAGGSSGPSTTTTLPVSHWTDRSPPSSTVSQLAAITCLDAQHCWALGTKSTGQSACCDLVVFTHDSGVSWSESSLPEKFTTPGGWSTFSHTAISCPTIDDCWVAGFDAGQPAIAASVDGGASWRIEGTFGPGPTNPVASSISCADSDHCAALFPLQPPLVVWMVSRLWKTADTLPANSGLATLACSSSADCVAAGTAVSGSSDCPPECGEIIESHDGGNTWTAVGSAFSGYYPNLGCVRSGSCWLPVDYYFGHSSPGAGFYTSYPSGSWQFDGGTSEGYNAEQISCTGTSYCMVAVAPYSTVAPSHQVFVTTDGKAWIPKPAPTRALLGVSCVSQTTCWVISGDSHVYETTDGAGN